MNEVIILTDIAAAKKASWDGRLKQVAMLAALRTLDADADSKWADVDADVAASDAEADYHHAALDLLNATAKAGVKVK